MTLRKRIALIISSVLLLALASLAIALSYTSQCDLPPADGTTGMKAVMSRCYGGPESLRVETLAKPLPGDDQIVVKVHAAALNPLDWHTMRGEPYFMRLDAGLGSPDSPLIGVDYAGVVDAVGKNVVKFKPGDAVFGGHDGAFAEFVLTSENGTIVAKPDGVTFEQAASLPIAAITALQGLRDHGHLKAGQKVLINGASGGVGTFAVQIAKAMGAHVTGVCSTRNLELVRSLGADEVIDYTQENFTDRAGDYDLILDNVGTQSFGKMRKVLTPTGRIVIVGATTRDPWLGPLIRPLQAMVVSPFVKQEMGFFIARFDVKDLALLAEFVATGKVKPVIDRTYTLDEIATAMAYLETGRARGKVVVRVGQVE